MSDIEDLLARARAVLKQPEPPSQTFFRAMPKDVELPTPVSTYREGHSRDADKFVVRMPGDQRVRLARAANLHHRSSNSEFVVALDWWLDRQALMWSMLQAAERELAIQESISNNAVEMTLDLLARRHPKAKELIGQLREQILN